MVFEPLGPRQAERAVMRERTARRRPHAQRPRRDRRVLPPFRQAVDETVDIRFLVMNDKHVAVDMATEFRAREDYPDFTRGPLKAGDTVRITSFVHYDIGPDGRFAAIRVDRHGDT
jgi:hypothetical protein